MDPLSFPSSLRRYLHLSGMTQRALATRAQVSPSSLSRYISGQVNPPPQAVEALDAVLDARGELVKDWRRSTSGKLLPEWARSLAAIEEAGRLLSVVSTVLVPGYLQCEAYARYVFAAGQPLADEDELDRLTKLRCTRLSQLPNLRVTAVFPLSALTGVPEHIARQQARHLLEWVDTGRVTIHLVPLGSILVVPTSPVMLFHLRSGDLVATSDHADGSVTLGSDSHDRVSALFTSALAASLPADLSLAALKDLA